MIEEDTRHLLEIIKDTLEYTVKRIDKWYKTHYEIDDVIRLIDNHLNEKRKKEKKMKRVISDTKSDVVSVDKFDTGKIYAVNHNGHVYKLVGTCAKNYCETSWIFKSVHSSILGSDGYYDTAKEAINAEINSGLNVWEFESVKEFAQWVLENVEE